MPELRFRISSGLLIGVDLAARKSRLSRSDWVRQVLDVASGIGEFSQGFVESVRLKVDSSAYRDENVMVRISKDQDKAYRRAASEAFFPSRSAWVSVILATTIRVSRLAKQIDRINDSIQKASIPNVPFG